MRAIAINKNQAAARLKYGVCRFCQRMARARGHNNIVAVMRHAGGDGFFTKAKPANKCDSRRRIQG